MSVLMRVCVCEAEGRGKIAAEGVCGCACVDASVCEGFRGMVRV